MGNTTALGYSTIDTRNLLTDVPTYLFHSLLGGNRVLKTFQCLSNDDNNGYIVIKIYQKRDTISLIKYEIIYKDIYNKIYNCNLTYCLLPYIKFIENEKAGYLIRSYITYNLYDRFSSHPFLNILEKKWIVYQILNILKQLYINEIYHGDIKSENILCTSWNWLFLTDFNPFKPTYLPDDNPADFSFYFESNRSNCYVAPERFYKPIGIKREANLDHKMDIFSAGCVIAEIYLEGEALFDLSQLLSYRQYLDSNNNSDESVPYLNHAATMKSARMSHKSSGHHQASAAATLPNPKIDRLQSVAEYQAEDDTSATINREDTTNTNVRYDPSAILKKINDPLAYSLISHMIQLDPKKRNTAVQYLNEYSNSFFPDYFPYLYQLNMTLMKSENCQPDAKVQLICNNYEDIMRNICGVNIPVSQMPAFFDYSYHLIKAQDDINQDDLIKSISFEPLNFKKIAIQNKGESLLRQNDTPPNANLDWIKQLKRSPALATDIDSDVEADSPIGTGSGLNVEKLQELISSLSKEMNIIDINESSNVEHNHTNSFTNIKLQHSSEGLSVIISILCSCLRNVRFPFTKIKIIELLQSFGFFVDDDIRLGRILPFLVTALSDSTPLVRSTALNAITNVLACVRAVPESDTNVFPEYILPMLASLPLDSSDLVRVTLAQNLARLAEISRTFLELTFVTKTNNFHTNYDAELTLLQDLFSKLLVDMLTTVSNATNSKIKQAFLSDITRLCVFFGRNKANNFLLPLLITVLNDRDWLLRATFFEHICGVAVFLGRISLQNFILPCIDQALYDVEEFVVVRALQAMNTLCLLGLFDTSTLLNYSPKIVVLICHQSLWIRHSAQELVISIADRLGAAKTFCFLFPYLIPFLRKPFPVILTLETLSMSLKPPLSRNKFDEALRAFKESNEDIPETMEKLTSNFSKSDANKSLHNAMLNPDNFIIKNDSIIFLDTDEEVYVHMLKYIGQVAMALKQKNNLWRYNMEESDENHENHDKQLNTVPLYSVITPLSYFDIGGLTSSTNHTIDNRDSRSVNHDSARNNRAKLSNSNFDNFPEPISAQYNKQNELIDQNQAQIALYESFGVAHDLDTTQNDLPEQKMRLSAYSHRLVRPRGFTGIKPINNTPIDPNYASISKRNLKVPENDAIEQKIDELPVTIRTALKLPLPLPSLGKLNFSTASTSSFFRNCRTCHDKLMNPIGWRPRGNLLADLNEHKGSVTKLAVSRDNLFMASGSLDGTIKLWDCQKFKQSINVSSQFTYTSQASPILDLTICDSSHSIASCSKDGNIHVFKVEYNSASKTNNYAGISMVKTVDVSSEGPVLKLEHFNTNSESLLVYATQRGHLYGWDFRASRQAWKMTLDPSLGLCSNLICGPSPYSLVTGSSRGFISVWDIRFQIPSQLWRHSSHSEISHLYAVENPTTIPQSNNSMAHPTNGPLLFASTVGTNEVSAFDIYSGECREITRVNSNIETPLLARQAALNKDIKDKSTPIVSPSSYVKNQFHLPHLRSYGSSKIQKAPLDDNFISEVSQQCASFGKEKTYMSGILSCQDSFLITAGTDRIIRFWDLKNIHDSYRISAPTTSEIADEKNNVSYTNFIDGSISLFEETTSTFDSKANTSVQTPSNWRNSYPKRNGIQPAIAAHRDIITDIKAIDKDENFLVTSSRDGCIKVWV